MTKDMYILVGPPGSGKTTWIEKEFHEGCFVVSTDNIIQDVAESDGKTYDEVFPKFIKVADRLMWEGFDDLVDGRYDPIIVDRTNMSVKSRQKFFDRLNQWHKGHGYKIHAVVFPKPEDAEHTRRLNRPGKTIPPHVIQSMLASFEMPTLDEGFASVKIMETEND